MCGKIKDFIKFIFSTGNKKKTEIPFQLANALNSKTFTSIDHTVVINVHLNKPFFYKNYSVTRLLQGYMLICPRAKTNEVVLLRATVLLHATLHNSQNIDVLSFDFSLFYGSLYFYIVIFKRRTLQRAIFVNILLISITIYRQEVLDISQHILNPVLSELSLTSSRYNVLRHTLLCQHLSDFETQVSILQKFISLGLMSMYISILFKLKCFRRVI